MRTTHATKKAKIIQKTLVSWHRKHESHFPWRETTDPYRILISELMLQRTTRYQVLKVYSNFLQKYPSIEKLVVAPLWEIKGMLAPLGLRGRATRLKQLSEILMEKFEGRVPSSEAELLALPGVGEYVASVLRCFAYGERTVIIDTNVVRVLRRIYMIKRITADPSMDPRVRGLAIRLLPKKNWLRYNFTILDFANDVCRARWPKCEICPVKNLCCWDRTRRKTKLGKQELKQTLGF